MVDITISANQLDNTRTDKKMFPRLSEDMTLAKHGKIRMSDGAIKYIGSSKAYKLIEERNRTGFYASQGKELNMEWGLAPEDMPKVKEDTAHDDRPRFAPAPLPMVADGAANESASDGNAPTADATTTATTTTTTTNPNTNDEGPKKRGFVRKNDGLRGNRRK